MFYTWSRHPGTIPLVFVHGFTGGPDVWESIAPSLAKEQTAVGLVLPGHGPTAPVVDSFDGAVDAVAAAIRNASLIGCHMVGYSLGARLTLGLMVRHPDLVRRATLMGANPGLESVAERQARAASDARWVALLRDQGIAAFVAAWARQPLFASQTRSLSPTALAQQEARRLQHDPAGLARALETMGLAVMPNYWPALPTLRVPIRVVVGADDAKFMALGQRAVGLLPDAERVVLANCGHNPVLEAPQAVIDLTAA